MALSGDAEQKVLEQEFENDLEKSAVLNLAVILTLDGRSRAQKEPSIFEMEQTEAMCNVQVTIIERTRVGGFQP